MRKALLCKTGVPSILMLLLAGCSGPSPKPAPDASSGESKAVEPPISKVKTSGAEVKIESADGKAAYIVRAKESEIHMGSTGPDFGTMKDVDGDIVRDGEVVSRFKSPSAKVDKATETLELTGGVTVTSEPKKSKDGKKPDEEAMTMSAGTVKYVQGLKRIEATGSVTVTSGGMKMGPNSVLWATPDMKKIATPGKFK